MANEDRSISPSSVVYQKGTNHDLTLADDQSNRFPVAAALIAASGSAINLEAPSQITPYYVTTKHLTPTIVNASASGDIAIAAAVANQTTRLRRFWFMTQGTSVVTLKQGATTLAVFRATANALFKFDDVSGLIEPYYITAANAQLTLNNGGSVQIDGVFEYDTSSTS